MRQASPIPFHRADDVALGKVEHRPEHVPEPIEKRDRVGQKIGGLDPVVCGPILGYEHVAAAPTFRPSGCLWNALELSWPVRVEGFLPRRLFPGREMSGRGRMGQEGED